MRNPLEAPPNAFVPRILGQASSVSLEEEVERYKMSMVCPITQVLMTDPVVAADGHSYERSAIEHWMRTSNKSPMTGAELANRMLITNHTLRSIIKDHGAL